MPTQPPEWTHVDQQVGALRAAIIQPTLNSNPVEMIVLCHGFGAPGDDLVGIAEPLIRQLHKHDRFPVLVFPEAPIDLEEYGMPGGRAWWPLNMARFMELASKNDFAEMRSEIPPGLDDARSMLAETIETLLTQFSLDASSLTLGGFSQGGMLATDTALRGLKSAPKRLAILSGALICEPLWRSAADRLKTTDVVQSHGRYDMILPIQTGRWLNEFFRDCCNTVQYHEFDGPHTIPMEAIEMISKKSK